MHKAVETIRDVSMSGRRTVRSVHLASTIWFMLCVGYIMILALRQARVRWWVIFSLSGHSALVVFMLISLYLFAIFRGVVRSQKIEVEHPLTSTSFYMVFYAAAPFLGGLAGCLGMIGESAVGRFLLGIALGTLVTTFLVWVVVDPAVGLLEMLIPASRKHRLERLARAKAEREKEQEDSERFMAQVIANEESDRCRWKETLKPQAERLAELLVSDRSDLKQAEREAVDIGVNAWQLGGMSCMRELRDMAIAMSRQKSENRAIVDYISVWWDGIGGWRNASLG